MVASGVTAGRHGASGRRFPSPGRRSLLIAAVLFSTLRFGAAVNSGRQELVYGDYAATLPGAYVERLNPTLWNSPDLSRSWAYHGESYLHGPTQFLTLYHLGYLDSYAQIARLLLIVYAIVTLAAVLVMWRTLTHAEEGPVPLAAVYAATLSFFPMIQAYSQREFENVLLLAVALMFWAAVRDRQGWFGGLLAYVTWFKYLPIVVVPYVAARRWGRALLTYLIVSGALLSAAHLLFDLRHFFDNLVPTVAGSQIASTLGQVDFCRGGEPGFSTANRTFAGIRWGLCTLQDRGLPIPLPATYLLLVAACATAAIAGFVRLERQGPQSPGHERWRRILELSIALTCYTTFFFTHYYYLSVLIVPVTALLVRFLAQGRRASLGAWFVMYACLSTFTIPVGLIDRIIGVKPWEFDAWDWYMRQALYLPGELLLLALLLREYVGLSGPASRT